MLSMAIKINVPKEDQVKINQALERAGYPFQRRKFHCTLGFIEKMIPKDETPVFGERIVSALHEIITLQPPFYEVESVAHLFGHVIAFVPTASTIGVLKEMNVWLFEKVQEISHGRWNLNQETVPENFIPHLTLWRTRRPDARLRHLKAMAQIHPSYALAEPAYVIFN